MRTLSTMRSAMMALMRVNGTGSVGSVVGEDAVGSAVGVVPGTCGAGTCSAAAFWTGDCADAELAARSTSSLVMRPSEPVPAMRPRSRPCSLAMRRARGEERMRPVTCAACGGADSWTGDCATTAVRGSATGLWRRRFRRCGSCGLCASFADDGDDGVDLDGGAFRKANLSEHASHGRGDLGVHLVGGDFEERLVFLDGVADGS